MASLPERAHTPSNRARVIGIVSVSLLVIGLVARAFLFDVESYDYLTWLSNWYDQIAQGGGFPALASRVGNYNFPYQFLVALLTCLPVPKLYAYKLLSCAFDLVLAWAAGSIAARMGNQHDRRERFLIASSATFLLPTVMINSAGWAQCDSIWTSLALLSLVALMDGKHYRAAILIGVSLAFKLQACFFFPFFLYYALTERKFGIADAALVLGTLLLCGAPALLFGRSPLEVIDIYKAQTVEHLKMTAGYPNLWSIAIPVDFSAETRGLGLSIEKFACCFAAVVYIAGGAWLYLHGIRARRESIPALAMLSAYTAVLFLPAMHDRYAFPVDVLLVVLVLHDKRFLPCAVSCSVISLFAYSAFLFSSPHVRYPDLAVLNLATYLACGWIVLRTYGHERPGDALPAGAQSADAEAKTDTTAA